MFPLFQKTFGFLVFSGSIKREHLPEMGWFDTIKPICFNWCSNGTNQGKKIFCVSSWYLKKSSEVPRKNIFYLTILPEQDDGGVREETWKTQRHRLICFFLSLFPSLCFLFPIVLFYSMLHWLFVQPWQSIMSFLYQSNHWPLTHCLIMSSPWIYLTTWLEERVFRRDCYLTFGEKVRLVCPKFIFNMLFQWFWNLCFWEFELFACILLSKLC